MNWIETVYDFKLKDDAAYTYFDDVSDECGAYIYGFSSLPQLKALIAERLPGAFTEREIIEICRKTFRLRPEKQFEKPDGNDRQVVDFIYQF